MQFEGGRRSSHVHNLTPLIDIVFLLLIFFMLTSHFVREDTLNIQLPEAASGQPLDEKKSIEVVINAQAKWLYDGEVVTADKLKQLLSDDLSKLEISTVGMCALMVRFGFMSITQRMHPSMHACVL